MTRLLLLALAAIALMALARRRPPPTVPAWLAEEEALPRSDEYIWAMLERTRRELDALDRRAN